MAASAPSAAPIVCPGHTRPISELCFSEVTADGVFFVSACVDQQPMLREGATGNWIGTFTGHGGAVWAAKMNKAATRCLTASADFDIRLWNAIAGSELGVFPGGHVLKAVTYTHDETRFVAGGYSKKLMVFDPDTPGAPVLSIEHPTRIMKLAALSNGLIASGDEEGAVRLWSLEGDGSLVCEVNLDGASGVVHDLTWVKPTTSGPMSAGGLMACIGRWVVLMTVSSSGEAKVVRKLRTPFLARVDSAAMHPDGTYIVLGGGDAASAATTRGGVASLYVFMVSLAEAGAAAGSYAATASSAGSRLPGKRDFVGCSLVSISKGHVGPIRCLRFAPDGLRFASGGEDGNIRLWSFDSQQRAGTAGADDLPAVDDTGAALDGGKGTKVGAHSTRGPKPGGGVYRPGAFGGAKKR